MCLIIVRVGYGLSVVDRIKESYIVSEYNEDHCRSS